MTQDWVSKVDTSRGGAPAATPASPAPTPRGAPPPSPAAPAKAAPARPAAAAKPPMALFAMRVPKLGYFAAVGQGVGWDDLAYGPRHYPQTVLPGQLGTVGIAAHNVFWVQFNQLGAGDQVVLETTHGSYTYLIQSRSIVSPSDTTVFAWRPGRTLVMTTCWPLWAGALATQRLVFFAVQVSPA